jgi:hypothetical protein
MKRYDPEKAPDKGKWLGMDEDAKAVLVGAFHKRKKLRAPNMRIHEVLHVVVENQLAMGIAPVTGVLDRLLAAGLTRHDAIHAIASVLIQHLADLLKEPPPGPDPNESYFRELEALTGDTWMRNLS